MGSELLPDTLRLNNSGLKFGYLPIKNSDEKSIGVRDDGLKSGKSGRASIQETFGSWERDFHILLGPLLQMKLEMAVKRNQQLDLLMSL